MKTLCLLLLATTIAFGSYSRHDVSVPQPATRTSQEPTVPLAVCADLPASAVGITARRKATRTECSPAEARRTAVWGARFNARDALKADCQARTSRAEAEAICTAAGRQLLINQPNGGLGVGVTSNPGSTDAALPAGSNRNARLCVLLNDLEDEFESSTQADWICVFDGSKRTIFTARSRARCGVQCI